MSYTLYFFWSSPAAQRLRLLLKYKGVAYQERPLDYFDDETFFDLGIARQSPVLRAADGTLHTDSERLLTEADARFPDGPPLLRGRIDDAAWQALLIWRHDVDGILARLYACAIPGYKDVGGSEAALAAHHAEVETRYGMVLADLASDRYAGFAQLAQRTRIKALAQHLEAQRFYTGALSVADLLLTADLFPLQLLDGIMMPIQLLYYFERVQLACGVDLHDGWLVQP